MNVTDEYIGQVLCTMKERVSALAEIPSLCSYYFIDPPKPSLSAAVYDLIQVIYQRLNTMQPQQFTVDRLNVVFAEVCIQEKSFYLMLTTD